MKKVTGCRGFLPKANELQSMEKSDLEIGGQDRQKLWGGHSPSPAQPLPGQRRVFRLQFNSDYLPFKSYTHLAGRPRSEKRIEDKIPALRTGQNTRLHKAARERREVRTRKRFGVDRPDRPLIACICSAVRPLHHRMMVVVIFFGLGKKKDVFMRESVGPLLTPAGNLVCTTRYRNANTSRLPVVRTQHARESRRDPSL